MFDSYIEDVFGKRYVLKQPFELSTQKSFKSLSFENEYQALQFLKRLRVPLNFWQRSLSKVSYLPSENVKSISQHAERQVSKLLYRNQISIYELENYSRDNTNSEKRTVEKSNGDQYTFSHVSTLLVAAPLDLININSKADAEKLLQDIDPDKEQLNQIAKEFKLTNIDGADSDTTSKLIVEAMVTQDVVVSVQKKLSIPPKPTIESDVTAADKPVSLAPESTLAVIAATATDIMSNINQKSQADTLKKASEDGQPFCEECENAKAASAS